ncbi:MAG: AraC family transcriptional regulator [Pseudomonadota bacterium]
MRSLAEPCFLWFTKGQGRITIAGQTRGYTAHNGIFIPKGVMHGFEVGTQVFGTAVFFGEDPIEDLPTTPLHLRIRDAHAQQELYAILDTIQRELESEQPGHLRAVKAYMTVLSVWIDRQALRLGEDGQKNQASRRLVARFTALMEEKFRSGAGVGDLAADLGVTATHLTRCCRQTSGRSAMDLLQDRRIFEARKLLSETKLPINVIAASLGFTSAAYFTRAFQNRAGTSPRAFRRGL